MRDDGEDIITNVEVPPGMHVRAAAEDLRSGTTVLQAGRVLGVAELGAAVAAGAGRLTGALSSGRPAVI